MQADWRDGLDDIDCWRGWRKSLLNCHPTCFYCGVQVTKKTRSLDHYIPRSKGGLTTPNNIVVSCKNCNLAKGDKLPEDFDFPLKDQNDDGIKVTIL